MENDYQKKWDGCLAMIREKVNNERVFDTWFADVAFESYDPGQDMLLLRVPSHYVCKFMEQYGARFLSWAIGECFKSGTRLSFRVVSEPSFADVATWLQQHSPYDTRRDPFRIAVPDAKKRLQDGLRYFLKGSEKWLPGYDKVASWLADNRGRGLLVVGAPGLGKTLICQRILPVILGNGGRPLPCVSASGLNGRVEELKRERLVIIDDLGREPRKNYGRVDNSLFELCNNAERTGSLLIIATHLSTTPVSDPRYQDSIFNVYGADVLDRLKAVTSVAVFEGKSMRG